MFQRWTFLRRHGHDASRCDWGGLYFSVVTVKTYSEFVRTDTQTWEERGSKKLKRLMSLGTHQLPGVVGFPEGTPTPGPGSVLLQKAPANGRP